MSEPVCVVYASGEQGEERVQESFSMGSVRCGGAYAAFVLSRRLK